MKSSREFMTVFFVTLTIAVVDVRSSFAALGGFTQRILNPTPEGSDQFGYSIAATDTLLAVGDPKDNTGAESAGSVFVYDIVSRQLKQPIHHPYPDHEDMFGQSVSMSGASVLVGAPGDYVDGNRAAGAAYLFDAVTGTRLQTFENPAPDELDLFGAVVALSSDLAAISAPEDDVVGTDAGAVYLFDTQTGLPDGEPLTPVPGRAAGFGASLAWVGNDLAVGAPSASTVYLFDGDTKSLKNLFFTQTGDSQDRFGNSLSESNGHLLVGAPGVDSDGEVDDDVGAAYLIDVNTGALLQPFANPDPQEGDQFGFSVAATPRYAIVGALLDDTPYDNAGSAYVMDLNTGSLVTELQPFNAQPGDNFGISVAASSMLFVGASRVGIASLDFGAAYIFQGPADANGDGDVDGEDFLAWQRNAGVLTGAVRAQGDMDVDGDVDGDDLGEWHAQFGQPQVNSSTPVTTTVSEPRALLLAMIGLAFSTSRLHVFQQSGQ